MLVIDLSSFCRGSVDLSNLQTVALRLSPSCLYSSSIFLTVLLTCIVVILLLYVALHIYTCASSHIYCFYHHLPFTTNLLLLQPIYTIYQAPDHLPRIYKTFTKLLRSFYEAFVRSQKSKQGKKQVSRRINSARSRIPSQFRQNFRPLPLTD